MVITIGYVQTSLCNLFLYDFHFQPPTLSSAKIEICRFMPLPTTYVTFLVVCAQVFVHETSPGFDPLAICRELRDHSATPDQCCREIWYCNCVQLCNEEVCKLEYKRSCGDTYLAKCSSYIDSIYFDSKCGLKDTTTLTSTISTQKSSLGTKSSSSGSTQFQDKSQNTTKHLKKSNIG